MNLKIVGLRRHYDEERALDGVDLDIKEKSCVTVIGPSGGGKSTLLRIIAGLETPEDGIVEINGRIVEYSEKKLREHRKNVGVVFQSYNLFPHWTAIQNITVPLVKVYGMHHKQARERAMGFLVRFGLEEHASKYPVQLSGGQQQRISIARAMARSPELLILDEPTSALDPQLTKEVLEMVTALKEEGMDIVIATHEMAFARRASDYLVFIDNGIVGETGPAESFFDTSKKPRLAQFMSHVFE